MPVRRLSTQALAPLTLAATLAVTLGMALLAVPAHAGDRAAPRAKDDVAARRSAVERGAKDERLGTDTMWNLAWHRDWKAAMLRNRIEPAAQRPILHLRILGQLAEKT